MMKLTALTSVLAISLAGGAFAQTVTQPDRSNKSGMMRSNPDQGIFSEEFSNSGTVGMSREGYVRARPAVGNPGVQAPEAGIDAYDAAPIPIESVPR